jgi:hypothetical protein
MYLIGLFLGAMILLMVAGLLVCLVLWLPLRILAEIRYWAVACGVPGRRFTAALGLAFFGGLAYFFVSMYPTTAKSETLHNPPDCPQKLLAEWLWDRDAALADMPKQACLLYGEHDQYICTKSGCSAKS